MSSATLVPGLLQTEGYATGLMSAITDFREIPNDVADAVTARLERSRILHERGHHERGHHERGHRFVLVVEESALRYRMGDADAMAAQLGHLLTAGALPAVSPGALPAATLSRAIRPMETFHMYDDTLVLAELLSARVTVTQPTEIVYLKAFEELRSTALYGAEARALIVRAIEALA